MSKPVPTPSKGLLEVTLTCPNPIADPISEKVTSNARKVTIPAMIAPP